ncbi:hypothetical protein ACHAXA_001381 [Cyclostephanos tholiformis]|uniref:RING-type domain-containing protein n=1 Tax=Cyclostephanos tholiformis TaxID=382380 RepID=A0ABD3RKT7_9STRA
MQAAPVSKWSVRIVYQLHVVRELQPQVRSAGRTCHIPLPPNRSTAHRQANLLTRIAARPSGWYSAESSRIVPLRISSIISLRLSSRQSVGNSKSASAVDDPGRSISCTRTSPCSGMSSRFHSGSRKACASTIALPSSRTDSLVFDLAKLPRSGWNVVTTSIFAAAAAGPATSSCAASAKRFNSARRSSMTESTHPGDLQASGAVHGAWDAGKGDFFSSCIGEGGPLQWLGLAVFFLQFLAPHVMHLVHYELHHAVETTTAILRRSLRTVVIASALAGGIFLASRTISSRRGGGGGGVRLARSRDGMGNNASTIRTSGAGTADDPVVIDDDDDDHDHDHDGNNVNAGAIGGRSRGVGAPNSADGVRTDAQSSSSSSSSSSLLSSPSLALALVIAYVPLFISSPLLWNMFLEGITGGGGGGGGDSPRVGGRGIDGVVDIDDDGEGGDDGRAIVDSGFVHLVVLAILAHTVMAMAAHRVLRDVLFDGRSGIWAYPGNRRGGGIARGRGRKLTVTEIADIVRKVPVEEYVSEENVRTGDCSVARMKRMLSNRGAANAAMKSVERNDLVREIECIRNFNEECAICAEEYVEGDILRVTRCRHEFHLHCFDKWMYTFSTDTRPATHPTCPLCKATVV